MENTLSLLLNCGAHNFGAVALSKIAHKMSEKAALRAKRDMPEMESLICATFPYFAGFTFGNISLYARGADYHEALHKRLEFAVTHFKRQHPGHDFKVYVDSSPFPEVYAAARCGLGKIGDHGLLITEKYGSFVFIGTIATTYPIDTTADISFCTGCQRCIKSCPTGALGPDGFDLERCLSHISQLKGSLSEGETGAVARGKMVWGCDTCQKVCPMNRDLEPTPLPEFNSNLIYSVSPADVELTRSGFIAKYGVRSFLWRGMSPLRRNMKIISKSYDYWGKD